MSTRGGASEHRWRFFRAGGFDQVRLDTGADLLALPQLDQKLWVALACPTRGLEFDTRTLELIDAEADGRIRPRELLEAVRWAGSMLRDPDLLTQPGEGLSLSAIDDSHPQGRGLLESARQVLVNLGRPEAQSITLEDVADTARIFAQTRFNGDGIVPAGAADDPATRRVIEEVMDCMGADTDRCGDPGVSEERVRAFFAEARAYSEWWRRAEEGGAAVLPLGEATGTAAAAWEAVRAKIDDYFTRCRLAEFDPRAADPLNPSAADYATLAVADLADSGSRLVAFPIARCEAGRDLPLATGVNPAWTQALARFSAAVVAPLLGRRESLSAGEWQRISAGFRGHADWLAAKAGMAVEPLGPARVRELLAGDFEQAILELIARDRALQPQADAVASVERLLRYHRDLHALLNNFVSFRDFYTRKARAVFQAGTLYLDGRSCELCVRVDDVAAHSALANLARIYLAYCQCSRRGSEERMTIAAAFTGGDADFLMPGRNGVFYDRQGRDWDATVVKLVEHPISLRQAFSSPYKRVGKMIAEQVEKFAAARDQAVQEKASAGIAATAAGAEKGEAGKPAAPPAPFDIGKFVGIFAAIGLALGAIGSAVAAVVTGFLGLTWWQMPLALAGLVLAVSGPSMLIAYLKLRQRNLGPILDASGWAVNGRAMINIPFGGALTALAILPEGAERSLTDPYAERRRPWRFYLVLIVLLAALAALWHRGYLDRWLAALQPPPAKEAPAPAK
jgi:hypothetical protein